METNDRISEKQVRYVLDLLDQNDLKEEDLEKLIGKKINEMTRMEASSVIEKIRATGTFPLLEQKGGENKEEKKVLVSSNAPAQNKPLKNAEAYIPEASHGMPIDADVEFTKNVLNKFFLLKSQVLDINDSVNISGRKFIKRSGWRKIALAFNISTEISDVQRTYADGIWIVYTKARAMAPNGRYAIGTAVCDSSEFATGKLKGTLHNIETKSATRAINRAISDLVGGGEVSAEELE